MNAGIGQALQQYSREIRYYQSRNEQAQVHAAVAYAKHKNRLQTFACTSSIGPGATNMVTGAAQSDAAVLVIDALEGMREQSRRHAYLLSLLGVRQIVAAVNKMDLVGYDRARFEAVARDCRDYLTRIGVACDRFVPISARGGDNVAQRSTAMLWYAGPTILEALRGPEARPARRGRSGRAEAARVGSHARGASGSGPCSRRRRRFAAASSRRCSAGAR